jgi:Sensors of blue-light using FAD
VSGISTKRSGLLSPQPFNQQNDVLDKHFMIIYCSRSRLRGTPAEVEMETRRILATARINNKRARVTGAMTFNEIGFAQVLEGATYDVMSIFDRIRQDKRHYDLRILSQTNTPSRVFPTWSMAYVGRQHGDGRHPLADFNFEAALTEGASHQAAELLKCLRKITVR